MVAKVNNRNLKGTLVIQNRLCKQELGDDDPDTTHGKLSARMMRYKFDVEKKIKSATVYIPTLNKEDVMEVNQINLLQSILNL